MEVTICQHSWQQLRSIRMVSGLPEPTPDTTPGRPAHAPAAPSRAFTHSRIICGRVPAGAPLNALLRNPLMREKDPFLFLLSG